MEYILDSENHSDIPKNLTIALKIQIGHLKRVKLDSLLIIPCAFSVEGGSISLLLMRPQW